MRDGLRLAGIRDHADEDADFGVASDDVLHTDYEASHADHCAWCADHPDT